MRIVIDGKDAALGRLASYAAKQALGGEEVLIVNCDEVIITGNKRWIRKDFVEKRSRVGTTQQGPKIPRTSERVVKMAIRGMLPSHKEGRGKVAYRKVKCYAKVPKELESVKKKSMEQKFKNKFIVLKEITK